ncbi:dTDP-4-dehydrorhamnose reductase [Antarcticibacterium flavum]|uniref:dTDP-4-dehydrorhamnose reductase n=1 Tax=Antarcticibacterium flavum TaxID=2058175 RepID=A0A5B7X4D0_9FLAO|nr:MULTISPECIES: dTDP-4-dehydrorhamnose reductase [Antarcticibacterium]MCM4159204.1 dTDP-4-dehydrorhamnose reductase [Antarcticibacterium sp. W02-3]QCY69602.1 dTDP-4-dehydrorhamnose reductase [Antarcticibacterium flavum]
MKTVLITGAGGQLGKCFELATREMDDIDWLFMDSNEVDITLTYDLQQVFSSKRIDFCINCAAYTNVEKAEDDREKAFLINATAVKNLAEICKKNRTVLFHFSTDYVFDGSASTPYKEEDQTAPINVYGASKLKGEQFIEEISHAYFIFRTSWLYSQFGHNFYKTILNKAREGAALNITTSQTGTPTNANHLARLIVGLIKENNSNYGLYHYSNTGQTTWYGFAREILKISGNLDSVSLKEDNSYQTIAKRPAYSVLDKEKVQAGLSKSIASWEDALKELYETGSVKD